MAKCDCGSWKVYGRGNAGHSFWCSSLDPSIVDEFDMFLKEHFYNYSHLSFVFITNDEWKLSHNDKLRHNKGIVMSEEEFKRAFSTVGYAKYWIDTQYVSDPDVLEGMIKSHAGYFVNLVRC